MCDEIVASRKPQPYGLSTVLRPQAHNNIQEKIKNHAAARPEPACPERSRRVEGQAKYVFRLIGRKSGKIYV